MKVLVVGSRGFIGRNLVEYLQKKHVDVWGADVIVDYVDTEKYFLIDATNADYHTLFEQNDFDVCINCSGAASVPDSLEKPYRDFQLNTANVFKLLESIRVYRPGCKFINLSSAAVYGNPSKLPVKERAGRKPLSPYGYHKMMSEQICEEFHQLYNLKTCSLRIFSAYGEGLKKQLFWDLFQRAKKNGKVSLYGTGKESRDFIYVMDLVQAIEVIAQNGSFDAEIINVGNGDEIFIEQSVKIFYSLFDRPINYEFTGTARPGDPDNWVAETKRLKALGYRRKYSFKEGLKAYYLWAKKVDID